MSEGQTGTARPPAPPAEPKKRRPLIPVIFLVVLAAAFFIWRGFFANPAPPPSLVELSGRIEGDDSAIAPKTAGRILEIRYREGDSVKAGDVIAVLDDDQVRARQEQARAGLAAAEARAQSARDQISILQEQLRQNELLQEQSTVDANGRVAQAQAEYAAAEADLAQQQAQYQLALFDRDAYVGLAKTGAVSERQGKQAETTAEQQQKMVAAVQRRYAAAKAALEVAKANLSNPPIRGAAAGAVRRQIAQQQAEIAGETALARQARYQLDEAQYNRNDLTVKAPFDGTVITRAAEPGEVVQAGTALVTLLDLRHVYLRGYIPEGQIGKVKIGQPARVYLDSNPSQPIEATVIRIDPEATFTPENTYFRDDRVKQVVGVKVLLKGSYGYAKPGMPADGAILVQGETWPAGWRHQ